MTVTNETEKPPIDAVRAKIAEMRRLTTKEREYAEYCAGLVGATQDDDEAAAEADDKANAMEWAADALEAVLDAAPCDEPVSDDDDNELGICGRVRHPHDGECHPYQAKWLEAALTRAITKGEQ